jgi:hypothetical protein
LIFTHSTSSFCFCRILQFVMVFCTEICIWKSLSPVANIHLSFQNDWQDSKVQKKHIRSNVWSNSDSSSMAAPRSATASSFTSQYSSSRSWIRLHNTFQTLIQSPHLESSPPSLFTNSNFGTISHNIIADELSESSHWVLYSVLNTHTSSPRYWCECSDWRYSRKFKLCDSLQCSAFIGCRTSQFDSFRNNVCD